MTGTFWLHSGVWSQLQGYLFEPVDKESLLNILKNVIIKANE